MTASIHVHASASVQYLLRIGDTCLIHAQRLAEWCGHAPVLEEDIALSNMALDLLGQARGVLTLAGQIEAREGHAFHDEDQLAFLRDERDYRNLTLVELPRGDFAFAVVRNTMLSTWLRLLWERLASSSESELAAIAGKAVKEARYHQQHAADWLVRLGDGTDESQQRCREALSALWRYMPEMFSADAVDAAAVASGLGPRFADLQDAWLAEMREVLDEATLSMPAASAFRSEGTLGRHSEHMGHLLTTMQHLQRSFPEAVW